MTSRCPKPWARRGRSAGCWGEGGEAGAVGRAGGGRGALDMTRSPWSCHGVVPVTRGRAARGGAWRLRRYRSEGRKGCSVAEIAAWHNPAVPPATDRASERSVWLWRGLAGRARCLSRHSSRSSGLPALALPQVFRPLAGARWLPAAKLGRLSIEPRGEARRSTGTRQLTRGAARVRMRTTLTER